MKKTGFVLIFVSSMLTSFCQSFISDPVEMVNPLMGTDSKPALSNGNTYPAICLPWGMNFWTPQTGTMNNGWQYQYSADKIIGFKQTHEPSPWVNDFGQFSLTPVTGTLKFTEQDRASWFSHKTEVAKPYYYSVYLADADVTTEITPTERAAQFRFTYPRADSSFIIVDAFDSGSYIRIFPEQNKITGYTTRNSKGVPANFKNYFVIYFNKPFTLAYVWHDSILIKNSLEITSNHSGAVVGFKTVKGEIVDARVASSFISLEQAETNLKNELGNDGFEITKEKAKAAWNKVLNKILVQGERQEEIKTFYSCLYRSVCFPQKLYEIDPSGKIIHYSPYNGLVLPGYMFGGTGFWDTFRALYPFLNLVYPSVNKEMQEGLINDYKEGGWLPEWSSPGYRNGMIGNNSASVVSDAYIKGIRGYDISTLYSALVKDANNEGPLPAVGRLGIQFYIDKGFVPYNVGIRESAARTLEYAYDDFCIYQLAKALKRPQQEINLYARRSQNFRNVFDSTTRLMRGRNLDGTFQSPFNPFKWGDAFTEGNSWHYTWSVFQDIESLKRLMGGNDIFVGMLDSIFKMPPTYDESYYRYVIHEIREMQVMNMGQYAHGNQPIQHMLYLYNYAGQPWKTQYWVREAMSRLYKPTPDGYCGDDDNGQTSAWYVFSALGFYPVCPATDQYVLGTPLFRKVKIILDNGKQVIINAPNNDTGTPYVQSLELNGKNYDKNWISHSKLQKGCVLNYKMTETPNRQRGTRTDAYPYSFSRETK